MGSAMEVPQNGDEVMSDPDPEVVEAHSSAAVRLAFSTLDEVDLTRDFQTARIRDEDNPKFPQRPIPNCTEGRIHFHPKSISSNDTFIQTRFHPMTLSSKHDFIQ